MVINIPSDSEASDATVISGFPIDEEKEIQSIVVQQMQQKLETHPMARTCKKQVAIVPKRELRQPSVTQPGEVSAPPPF